MIDQKFLDSLPPEMIKAAERTVEDTMKKFKTLRELDAFHSGLTLGIDVCKGESSRMRAKLYAILLMDAIINRRKDYEKIINSR